MTALLENIKNYIPVSKELENEIENQFSFAAMAKKELFVREGQFNVSLAFIQSGTMRCFNIKDDKDVTNDFFFENTFVTDFGSLTSKAPARQNFEIIEDVVVQKISGEQLFKMAERFPEVQQWGSKMAEQLFMQSLRNQAILKSDSPEERYNRLIKEKPDCLQRIPLHYIASYLGITQVHLSRIRSKR